MSMAEINAAAIMSEAASPAASNASRCPGFFRRLEAGFAFGAAALPRVLDVFAVRFFAGEVLNFVELVFGVVFFADTGILIYRQNGAQDLFE